MTKKNVLSLAVGTAFAATAMLSPVAHAADNPFGMQKMSSGYLLAEADTKMKDGSCGGEKKQDGSCGDKKAEKMKDGSCGDKKKDGSCGDKKVEKKKDGKCGEGKCGANKKKMENKDEAK